MESIIEQINNLPVGAWYTEEEARKLDSQCNWGYLPLVRKRLFLEKQLTIK